MPRREGANRQVWGGNRFGRSGLLRAIAVFVVLIGCLSTLESVSGGEERFDYDPNGRLIRVIDEQNRVTEYLYDPAGNLLRVITDGMGEPPLVTAISPDRLRRGEARAVTLVGSGFQGVRLGNTDPGLALTDVRVDATRIEFTATAADTAHLGSSPITLVSAAGSATTALDILPRLPRVSVSPTPLAVPPDGLPHPFSIRLSNPDVIDHAFTLSSQSQSIAKVAPPSISIAAGQTEGRPTVTGIAGGLTNLSIASTTLGDSLVPVFVTAEYQGINTSYASPLGVVLQAPVPPPQPQPITLYGAAPLGVVLGSHLSGINPNVARVGTTTWLSLNGQGLDRVTDIGVIPPDGISLGTRALNAEGTVIAVPVTVAVDAPLTLRRVVLRAGTEAVPPASPGADRLYVAAPEPEVTSVEPQIVVPGSPGQAMIVRGRNLQGVQTIAITPNDGILVDAQPSANAAGNEVSLRIAVSPLAPLGPRLVRVTTPSGTSSAIPTPENTFSLVNELGDTFTPIAAPLLGLVLEAASPPPPTSTLGLGAPQLGVTLGSVVTGIVPSAGSIGDTLTLTISGTGLHEVTTVEPVPATGIVAGPPAVAADGRSLTLSLTLAADAPQSLRTLLVKAGTATLPAAPSSANQFRVTAPLPEIHSVEPLYLQVGQPPTRLSIRGRNYQNLRQVRLLPAEGISLGTPVVDASAGEISLDIAAAADVALGTRILVVETAAGATSATSTVANSIRLIDAPGTLYTPLVAAPLGVALQAQPTPPHEIPIGPITAANLGLLVETLPPPPFEQSVSLPSAQIGLALGATAFAVSPAGLPLGANATLTISGYALGDVTAVALSPANGITLGTPTVNAEGTQMNVPVSIDTAATVGWHELLLSAGTGAVSFSDTGRGRFFVATGIPSLDSIEPILGAQGEALTLTVRGQHLQAATEVSATPGDGVTFSFPVTINAAGTELTLPMGIAPDAPLGSRVIQVTTPAGTSGAAPLPANTFTLYPP